jgi:L-alanine-DL-glutamate epimerase-like enolase superfamily enzyme
LNIDKIETWACDMPISHSIDLGKFIVRQRSYLVVRIHSSDGILADCVTQSRGSPLDTVIMDVIAPRILGKDALNLTTLRANLERELTALELYGAIGRAWSAVEICLQDLRAQAVGWPLWRLLGGFPRTVPVQLVEGYAISGEADDAMINRLAARVEQGFRFFKIEAGHYASGAELLRQLEQLRARLGDGPQVVLDMGWAWPEFKSKMQMLLALEGMGIAWIEDPFSSNRVQDYQELRRKTNVPVGAGDETSRAENIYALLEANALDVIRLDATTMGGIDGVRALSTEASRRGVRVAYHVYPEVHEHLVFGLGIADHVEMFPTDRQFDRVHDLIVNASYDRVLNGNLSPSDTPGTGLKIDLQKIAPFVRRHLSSSSN